MDQVLNKILIVPDFKKRYPILHKYLKYLGSKLLPDFFLDEFDEQAFMDDVEAGGGTPRFSRGQDSGAAAGGAGAAAGAGGIAGTFTTIQGMLNEDAVKSMGGVFLFDLKGESDCCP